MPSFSSLASSSSSTRADSHNSGPYGKAEKKNKGGKGKGKGKSEGALIFVPEGSNAGAPGKGKGKGNGKNNMSVQQLAGQLSEEVTLYIHDSVEGTKKYLEVVAVDKKLTKEETVWPAVMKELSVKIPAAADVWGLMRLLIQPDDVVGIFMGKQDVADAQADVAAGKEPSAKRILVRGRKAAQGPSQTAKLAKMLLPVWVNGAPQITMTREKAQTMSLDDAGKEKVLKVVRAMGGAVNMEDADFVAEALSKAKKQ
jgi:hypothetical protein